MITPFFRQHAQYYVNHQPSDSQSTEQPHPYFDKHAVDLSVQSSRPRASYQPCIEAGFVNTRSNARRGRRFALRRTQIYSRYIVPSGGMCRLCNRAGMFVSVATTHSMG